MPEYRKAERVREVAFLALLVDREMMVGAIQSADRLIKRKGGSLLALLVDMVMRIGAIQSGDILIKRKVGGSLSCFVG
jgi:hypothetical protein